MLLFRSELRCPGGSVASTWPPDLHVRNEKHWELKATEGIVPAIADAHKVWKIERVGL